MKWKMAIATTKKSSSPGLYLFSMQCMHAAAASADHSNFQKFLLQPAARNLAVHPARLNLAGTKDHSPPPHLHTTASCL